jgi:uncharacterized small protein (DUF1192 family)
VVYKLNKILTPEEYELNLMEKEMLDKKLEVEDVIDMYNEKILILQKEIDRLNEEVQALNLQLKNEREKNEKNNT